MWNPVWSTRLPSPACFIKYSPDGVMFATCGHDDSLVKIWYQDMYGTCFSHEWHACAESERREEIVFTFLYLQHPAVVSGFEWRRTSRYMHRCLPARLS